MTFSWSSKRGNICCEHKKISSERNQIRNLFCVCNNVPATVLVCRHLNTTGPRTVHFVSHQLRMICNCKCKSQPWKRAIPSTSQRVYSWELPTFHFPTNMKFEWAKLKSGSFSNRSDFCFHIKIKNAVFREEATSAFAGFHWCGSSIQVKLEFGNVGFSGGRITNNKLNPHMAPGQNQTRATLEGGERSHHCAISAPQNSRHQNNSCSVHQTFRLYALYFKFAEKLHLLIATKTSLPLLALY